MASGTRGFTVRFLAHVLAPLVLGTLIYVAFRSKDIHVVGWLSRIGATEAARGTIGRAPVPAIVVGALPDLAWAWAFGAMLSLVWRGKPMRDAAPWLAAGAFVALGSEIGQGLGLLRGTFDVVDLVSIAAGFAGGAYVARR